MRGVGPYYEGQSKQVKEMDFILQWRSMRGDFCFVTLATTLNVHTIYMPQTLKFQSKIPNCTKPDLGK